MHLSNRLILRQVSTACKRAFTLVEILVSITILLILMVALFQLTATLGSVWTSSRGKISAFENARFAFSTLTSTLSRATLNTYVDYVNVTGATTTYRTASNATTFIPTQFGRASELHFISGQASIVTTAIYDSNTLPKDTYRPTWTTPAATIKTNPGHAVFFQAPLGVTTTDNASKFTGMNKMLNSVGFYIQYGQPPSTLFPSWLQASAPAKDYRFRLVEFVEPTENLVTHYSATFADYDSGWINFAALPATIATSSTVPAGKPRPRILAEDVLLLILRPRVSETDEATVATKTGATYQQSKFGSYLCPNYHYDSRAWMPFYPNNRVLPVATLGPLMCNQVPPIVDVVMICADPQSIARLGTSSATPSASYPSTAGMFANSYQMEADLNSFTSILIARKINFHIMRSSVQIQSSRWSNN